MTSPYFISFPFKGFPVKSANGKPEFYDGIALLYPVGPDYQRETFVCLEIKATKQNNCIPLGEGHEVRLAEWLSHSPETVKQIDAQLARAKASAEGR